jgi:hypothetical protein
MRGRSNRHPLLETAVFAAALILAAFVARELWRRRSAVPESPLSAAAPAATAAAEPMDPPASEAGSPTEKAVGGLAPLKRSPAGRRRPRPAVVPAPR